MNTDRYQYRNIIKNFCYKNNIICSIKSTNKKRFIMAYQTSKNTILYNKTLLINLKEKLFSELKLEEFLIITLCHEIGHYVSIKTFGIPNLLKPYYNENNLLKFPSNKLIYLPIESVRKMWREEETKAWEYGKTYIPKYLIDKYEELIKFFEIKM